MNIPSEIKRIAAAIEFYDCAKCVHERLMLALVDAGFGCRREVDAFYEAKLGVRRGRVDLVAYRNGVRIGIEIDNYTPRKKSVLKLVGMDLDFRFIVLRRKRWEVGDIAGIDGVFYIQPPAGFGAHLKH